MAIIKTGSITKCDLGWGLILGPEGEVQVDPNILPENVNIVPGTYVLDGEGSTDFPLTNGEILTIDHSSLATDEQITDLEEWVQLVEDAERYLDTIDVDAQGDATFKDNLGNALGIHKDNNIIPGTYALADGPITIPLEDGSNVEINASIFATDADLANAIINLTSAIAAVATADKFSNTVNNNNGTATVTNADGTQVDVLTEVSLEELAQDTCYDLLDLPSDACNIINVVHATDNAGCGKIFKYVSGILPSGFIAMSQWVQGSFDTVFTGVHTYSEDVGPASNKETHLVATKVIAVADYPGLACVGVKFKLTARASVHYNYVKINPAANNPQWGFDLFVNGTRIAQTFDDYGIDNTGDQGFVGGEISGEFTTTGGDLTIEVKQYMRYSDVNAANYVGDILQTDMAQIGVDFLKI